MSDVRRGDSTYQNVNSSPYEPPHESALDATPETVTGRGRSVWSRATQFICYGWLAIIFLMWQMDGLNFLIQRDIGRLVSLTTACITGIVAILYVRHRNRTMIVRTMFFVTCLALLQIAVMRTIANHSVDRFPM